MGRRKTLMMRIPTYCARIYTRVLVCPHRVSVVGGITERRGELVYMVKYRGGKK